MSPRIKKFDPSQFRQCACGTLINRDTDAHKVCQRCRVIKYSKPWHLPGLRRRKV